MQNYTNRKQIPREIEAALIIYHEHPDHYIDEISVLASIGRFELVFEATQIIHDLYFDTSTEKLKKNGLALRIRKVGDHQYITMKGDSRPTVWGGHSRLEIEQAWSKAALITIMQELNDRKIQLPQLDDQWDFFDSQKVLNKIGLEIIQQRCNQRRIRNIVSSRNKTSPVLAEMAIDTVAFQIEGQIVHLHELEIESKSAEGVKAVEEIVGELLKKYELILRKWDHSKLATGKAIEKLFETGILDYFVDDFSNLTPAGYDKIDAYLKSDSI